MVSDVVACAVSDSWDGRCVLDANNTSGLAKALLLAAGLTACESYDVVDHCSRVKHGVTSRSQRQSLSYEVAP